MKKVFLFTSLLVLNFSTGGCEHLPKEPVSTEQNAQQTSPVKLTKTSITGKVEFPNGYKTKASIADIATSATVSLINPNTNTSIATGLTDINGGFSINPSNSFNPNTGDTFILEVTKRLGGAGNTGISLRTILKKTDMSWDSITSPSIYINTKTTAIAIMSSLNPTDLPVDKTIGALQVVNGTSTVGSIAGTTVTATNINQVKSMIEQIMSYNQDSVARIGYTNNKYGIIPDNLANVKTVNTGLSIPVTVANDGAQAPKIVRDGNNLFVATINNGYAYIYKSDNEGLSFLKVNQVATLGPVRNQMEFNFTASNGVLYFTWQDQNNGQLYMAKSIDAGQNWDTPTLISNGVIWADNPYVYVYNNNPYVLFRAYINGKIELYLLAPDGSTNQVTNNNDQEDAGKIIIDPSGTIYVAYQDQFNTNNTYMQKSNDGINFENPIQINKTSGKSSSFDIASNTKGDVFIPYTDTTNDYEGDLIVAKLAANTNNFTYTQASDNTYRNQNYPKIFVDQNDTIHLIWNDNRINKSYGSVFYTSSSDDGLSYKANLSLDNNGGISNGSLSATSNSVDIVACNYNTSPFSTLYYKFNF